MEFDLLGRFDAARRRLGRRGHALLYAAFIWFGQAGRIVSEPDPEPTRDLPLEYLPLWLRVGFWILPALFALVVAWWPPGWTRWGFIALVVPSSFRAISYLLSAILDPYPAGFVNAVIWASVTAFVVLCAGWPEPPPREQVPE